MKNVAACPSTRHRDHRMPAGPRAPPRRPRRSAARRRTALRSGRCRPPSPRRSSGPGSGPGSRLADPSLHGPLPRTCAPRARGAAVAIAISRACTRESSVSSGWKAQSRIWPSRTATGWPSTLGQHLDLGAVLVDPRRADEHGAHRVGAEARQPRARPRSSRSGGRRRCAAPSRRRGRGARGRRRSSRRRCRGSGSPDSACARIAGSSPSRSIAFAIVVLSPPGMTSPSRSRELLGASAPRPARRRATRSIATWAAKSPWLASTPIRSRSAPLRSGGEASR